MITQEELWDTINYDTETGLITWAKFMNGAKSKIGEEAGTTSCGYRRIQINNKRYMAHVLAWIYIMGKLPVNHIDHINGNTLDNSWKNLREANSKENAQNRKKNRNNSSGIKGVHYHKKQGRYHAYLDKKYIGSFLSEEEAAEAVKGKREMAHGFFAKF